MYGHMRCIGTVSCLHTPAFLLQAPAAPFAIFMQKLLLSPSVVTEPAGWSVYQADHCSAALQGGDTSCHS